MRKIFVLCLTSLLAGCAAPLTQQGRMVRQIQPDWATNCTFMGVVDASEGMGYDEADDRRGTLNKIRNQVAAMGGNAYVLSDCTSTSAKTLAQADAYKCQ